MSRALLLALALALGPLSAPAQDGSRIEVQPGLDYVRVHSLPDDLPLVEGALDATQLIVDVRYVQADAGQAAQLVQILQRPLPSPNDGQRRITLVLINGQTSEPLGAVLGSLQDTGILVLVGQPTEGSPGTEPRLQIEVSPDLDEVAYKAFDAGTPLAALLDPPVQKARFDEATLLDRFSGRANGTFPQTTTSRNPGTSSPSASAPHPYDRTLHRAINALIAMDALLRSPVASPGNGNG